MNLKMSTYSKKYTADVQWVYLNKRASIYRATVSTIDGLFTPPFINTNCFTMTNTVVWTIVCFHDMMTSSSGNIFRVTDHLFGEFTGPRWIPRKRPVTRSFDVFFDLRLNKRSSKQSWGWWFATLSRPLWRHWAKNTWIIVGNLLDTKARHLPSSQRSIHSAHCAVTEAHYWDGNITLGNVLMQLRNKPIS